RWTEFMLVMMEKRVSKQGMIANKILGDYLTLQKRTHSQALMELSSSNRVPGMTISVCPFRDSCKVWQTCSSAVLILPYFVLPYGIEN
ncbi:guanine nucleotide exchange factor subunit RIC1-like, partial [Daubentonia madagascariensis]